MKKLLIVVLLSFSVVAFAEFPSWGMTEQQFKMPNRMTKLASIGQQAITNNWQLSVTAPKAWHENIRADLTKSGEKNVLVTFKDSLYKSVSITSSKAKKMGQTVSRSENQIIKKQVVIDDKPDMDAKIEKPDFSEEFMSEKPVLTEVEIEMDMSLPEVEHKVSKRAAPAKKAVPASKKRKPASKVVKSIAPVNPVVTDEAKVEEAKEYLRKRYTNNTKVKGDIPYPRIKMSDSVFIKDGVTLVKRTKNYNISYYWMIGLYDESLHSFEAKSPGRYIKSELAAALVSSKNNQAVNNDTLVFTAVTDIDVDKNKLRRLYIVNKKVKSEKGAGVLKSGDKIYTSNNTALVVRKVSHAKEVYFWLKGEVNLSDTVIKITKNRYRIK